MATVIRDARVRDRDGPVDIAIEDGRIRTVGPDVTASGEREIDAAGGLVLPAFVESHTHLDMAFFESAAPPRETGVHAECIDRSLTAMEGITVDEVRENARRAVERFVANGSTHIRTHVCVTEEWGLDGLEAVLSVKESVTDIADVEVIAYQFKPGFSEAAFDRMEAAMEMGADVVGGRPNTENTDERAKQYVDAYFDLAVRYDADVDMHIDTTTDSYSRTLEYLADRTIEEGYEGRVHAGHACALPCYDPTHRDKVIELAAEAGVNVVTNPTEDQLITNKDTTSVRELMDAGVNVSISHNDIADTFYPFGSLDVLEAAWLLVHEVEFNTQGEWDRVIDCLTYNPARTLGLDGYGLEPGCRADLTVCRESTVRELLRQRLPRRCVLKGGRPVARNEYASHVDRTAG